MCMPRSARLARLTTAELSPRIETVKANIAADLTRRDVARAENRDADADHLCEQSHVRSGWLTSYIAELNRRIPVL